MRTRILGSTFLMILATACGGATASSGGSANDGGGTGGSAGGSVMPDAAPVTCTAGIVTFELTAAGSPAVTYCVGKNCGVEWLEIHDARGGAMTLTRGCMSDCTSCQQLGCDLSCALPQQLKPEGVRRQWDGTYYAATTCGQGTACANAYCAPPGRYVATMCAGVKNNTDQMFCETDPQQQCVDVEFDFPTADVVRGTVGPIK